MEEQPNKKLTDQQKGEKVFWVDNFFFFLVSKTLNKHGSGFARVPDLVLLTELER